MKLSGHLTLEIVDEITGKVIEKREQDNIITNFAYTEMVKNDNIFQWAGRNIFISTETATPVRSKTSIQCSGTAYQGSGQPAIQAFQNANPPYFVITQRLDAVVTPRTFQTVGLTQSSVGQVANTTVAPWAYLLLNTPCTQQAEQIINLTYRVTVQNATVPGVSIIKYPRWINDVCDALVNTTFERYNFLYNTVVPASLDEYNWQLLFVSNRLSRTGSTDGFGQPASGTFISGQNQNTLFYRCKQYWTIPRDNNNSRFSNGRIFNGYLCGNNFTTKTATGNRPESDPGNTFSAHKHTTLNNVTSSSNLQSAFAYSANPRDDLAGMFIPDNNPSGTGVLQFSEDPWTEKWPSIYRIRITEGGPVGTAKFVLGVKRFGGHSADANFTYSGSGTSFHPYIYAALQPYPNCHGWQYVAPIIAWDNYLTVQADQNGLSIINQFTGQHWDFDSTRPSPFTLSITQFRQFALDQARNLIYVADSVTGLWKINITNINSPVITQESTTPTYAVDVNVNGVVYAFMNLATTALTLTSSASSYTTNLNFTTVALTTSNWLNIHINKIHADTRMAICVRDNTVTNGLRGARVYWWSLAGGSSANNITTVQIYVGEHQANYAWSKGSDNRLWSGDGTLLSFNSSTIIRQNPGDLSQLNLLPQYGTESYRQLDGTINTTNLFGNACVAQDYWGNFVSNNANGNIQLSSTGASVGSYNENTKYPRMHIKRVSLPNGIVLADTVSSNYLTTGSSNTLSSWIWYKWNGTNWIPSVTYNNNTGDFTDTTGSDTRTTSSSFIDLIDGINVRFENTATGTSFVANEVYDQYVCQGFMKTNDTSLYIENITAYIQPYFEKVTLTPTIITAPNNYGVVVDGAPGNLGLSSAVSATTENALWHSILPEYAPNLMRFTIDGTPITGIFRETVETIPTQASLTTGQVIVYRNGLILCSTADVGKTLAGYFSYVARSD